MPIRVGVSHGAETASNGVARNASKDEPGARCRIIRSIGMVAIIILAFAGMFAIAGTFISIEAKRRADGSRARSMSPRSDRPPMGRATLEKN
jgi:hypothetical protein